MDAADWLTAVVIVVAAAAVICAHTSTPISEAEASARR